MTEQRPKLRPIQPQPASLRGQPILLLRDPIGLSDRQVFIPQALAPVLFFLDGTRNLNELRASLMIRAGLQLGPADLERLIDELDRALLLENERSEAGRQAVLATYRSAPCRPPSLADNGYPADPDALQALLDGYLAALPDRQPADRPLRGLISPHIDYPRGGPVYAQVWSRAAAAARAAELVVILGTDHQGSPGRATLTHQSYATPYGVLPTDQAVVEGLAAALGEEAAFAEELHHRHEHSIELATVWLHHVRRGEPCALVPILTGSFYPYVQGEAEPADVPALAALLETLPAALAGRRTLLVAAADLAHVGPAFEDPRPVDTWGLAQLKVQDEALIQTILAGDAQGFFGQIRAEGDQRNICGLPPIYLMLRLLGKTRGELTGYDRCPADRQNTSYVSICGVVLD